MKRSLLIGFVIVSHFSIINAQTCCSGGIPLSNSIGLANLEKGSTQIGINYDYNNLSTLNNGSDKLDDDTRIRITHSVLLNIGYSITNNFSVEGLFTWVNQRRRVHFLDQENLVQSSGIGDGVVLAKYNFNNVIGKHSALNVGLGAKIPIGSTTKTNNQGIRLSADLQPGSGAWDILYWTLIGKNFNFRPSFNVSARIIYRETGTNNSYFNFTSYEFGNEFQSFLTFSDQFLIGKTLTSPNISFKYRNAQRDKIGGNNLENTGGEWVSVIPNIVLNVVQNISFSVKAEIPIYSYIIGTQLTPTFRLTAGFLIKLTPKKQILNLN